MPVTIYPNLLKYKNSSGVFQGATCIKGDQGDTYTLNANDRTEIAALVDDAVFVETVTGTTPSITGQANFRYICGEVSTLSITPPASGTIIVRFSSGSTATILTLPNTVKMPDWWISPETNTVYELCIEDGVYGSVMSWAT